MKPTENSVVTNPLSNCAPSVVQDGSSRGQGLALSRREARVVKLDGRRGGPLEQDVGLSRGYPTLIEWLAARKQRSSSLQIQRVLPRLYSVPLRTNPWTDTCAARRRFLPT